MNNRPMLGSGKPASNDRSWVWPQKLVSLTPRLRLQTSCTTSGRTIMPLAIHKQHPISGWLQSQIDGPGGGDEFAR